MTEAERRLWQHLRLHQVEGPRFRRQHPVGPFVADFVCLDKRLVVEVDCSQHLESARDTGRDAWLFERGFRVLRFWNHEVLVETESVVAAILNAVGSDDPHPNLPPQAGEGAKVESV